MISVFWARVILGLVVAAIYVAFCFYSLGVFKLGHDKEDELFRGD